MHEILRKRILRRLEALPEGKLYQILDYIEFVESRYGEPANTTPSGLQSFAERLEDRMRARSVVPSVMSGTMKVFGAAGKVLDEVSSVGRGLVEGIGEGLGPPASAGPRPVRPAASGRDGSDSPEGARPADPAEGAAGPVPSAIPPAEPRTGPVLASDGDDAPPA